MKVLAALIVISLCLAQAQLLRNEKMLLGGDDHDLQEHYQLLGGDGHDLQEHHQPILGGDDHDKQAHKKKGGKKKAGKSGKKLLGVDGHGQQKHKKLLGGGDHDRRPHGKLMGSGDHDPRPHGKLLGSGDHDLRPHGKLLGAGDHDLRTHARLLGSGDHDLKPHGKKVLGNDGHDQQIHKKLLGVDGHGQRKVLGNDGHDQQKHKKLLGVDGHGQRKQKKMLGGDDHDKKMHKKRMLGKDKHDYKKHSKFSKKMLGADSHDLTHINVFKGFMQQFNRSYNSQKEFKKRYSIFRQNMKKVHVLQQNEKGSAKYGPTKFADLTEVEFRRMLGLRPHMKPALSAMTPAVIPDIDLPTEFDWREKNVVTPVKNQGMCGSCWAFSVTGNVEGQWAIKHQELLSLSEQELVDCDTVDEGCNGGLPENAYKVINELGGLELEQDYPYDGADEKCHLDKSKMKATVNGSVELPTDEVSIAKWLTANGPISIGINANALQFYRGGVSHPLKFLCNPENLDHGMLIVGYGVHTTKYLHRHQPYWIVKNSWGSDWGEDGYYRVYRGDGTCGVNTMATSAVVP